MNRCIALMALAILIASCAQPQEGADAPQQAEQRAMPDASAPPQAPNASPAAQGPAQQMPRQRAEILATQGEPALVSLGGRNHSVLLKSASESGASLLLDGEPLSLPANASVQASGLAVRLVELSSIERLRRSSAEFILRTPFGNAGGSLREGEEREYKGENRSVTVRLLIVNDDEDGRFALFGVENRTQAIAEREEGDFGVASLFVRNIYYRRGTERVAQARIALEATG